jgi:hypothetical protein
VTAPNDHLPDRPMRPQPDAVAMALDFFGATPPTVVSRLGAKERPERTLCRCMFSAKRSEPLALAAGIASASVGAIDRLLGLDGSAHSKLKSRSTRRKPWRTGEDGGLSLVSLSLS